MPSLKLSLRLRWLSSQMEDTLEASDLAATKLPPTNLPHVCIWETQKCTFGGTGGFGPSLVNCTAGSSFAPGAS